MKSVKKIVSVFLCICILILPVSFCSFAADITELTFLYADRGNIVIGDNSVSGFGAYGEEITQANPLGYCITMAGDQDSSYTVTVNGGNNYIVLKDVSLTAGGDYKHCFCVTGGASADIFFTGENTLVSGVGRAGLEISADSAVTLSGDGTLTAQSEGQAGIGGGNGGSNGTLTINSGTIIAKSKYESAGIGGGSSGEGGNITINGGNIYAVGGQNAAGIGGGNAGSGGNITINGGTVTAVGGQNGAGIGGGWYGRMGNVVINGGSVKATGYETAQGIGSGKGLANAFPVDGEGNTLYPAVLNTAGAGEITGLYCNGRNYNACGSHAGDQRMYLYVPAGLSAAAAKSEHNFPMLFSIQQNGTSATVTRLSNPSGMNGASIGGDDIIRGISCGLTDLDDYIYAGSDFSFDYDNEVIGTGTHVTLMYKGVPLYSYRALLYGDLNNDGFYDGEDSFIVLLMLWDLLTDDSTDAIYFEAADVNADGAVTQQDMEILQQAGLMLAEVSRNGSADTDSAEYRIYLSLADQRAVSAAEEAEDAEAPEAPEAPEVYAEKAAFAQNLLKFIENVIKFILKVTSFWNI